MFSNKYIFIYSAILVAVVAILLALAATLLQPFQNKNIELERMQYVLTAANIDNSKKNAESLYKKLVIEELVVNTQGDIIGKYVNEKLIHGKHRAFYIDLKTEMKKNEEGGNAELPVFRVVSNNDTLLVFPMQGAGLWGPIWGYISLKKDLNTIAGAVFDHKSETPGLGAEISTPKFQKEFENKQIFDKNAKFVSVKVVKGGVAGSKVPLNHGVDAISGGTITSNGTSNMIKNSLELYIPFIEKIKKS